MNKYQNIFTPLTIKNMTIRNRVAMPPMGTNYGGAMGDFTEEHVQYYEKRAKGGTGLIIVENACVDFPVGSNGTTQIRLDHDRYMPNLFRLTERLHRHGACVAIQINHSGASAVPGRIEGNTPVSSSNVPSKTGGAIPRPLTVEEIYAIADKYADAARRAQMAGFDAVEIHGGHSYLLCQFLSPLYNKRTDEFGGSLENRVRFPKLVLEKVRAAVGPMFPISFRFSADEFMEGGNTLEDTLEMMEYLIDEIDILNVSAAVNDTLQYQIDANYLKDGWRAYLSKAVKDKFNKPCITMGNIRNPQVAEDILERGDADLIGMGRGLIADPEWVNKVELGKEDELRKCISCNIGCAGNRIGINRPIRCTVNPSVNEDEVYKKVKVNKNCNVVVIGGGTAGLEAACTAAEVGCATFLIEKKDVLGGLATEISKIPDKRRLYDFPKYLINRAEKLDNLYVFKNTEANVEFIKNLKPNLIINATGSSPLLPPIKGLHEVMAKEDSKVFSILDMINNIENYPQDLTGKKVVIIGGGAVGLDVAEFFAPRNADCSIVEMAPVIGNGIDPVSKVGTFDLLNKHNVKQLTNTKLLEVKDNSFLVEYADGSLDELEFDYGFVCLGMKSNNPVLKALEEEYSDTNIEIISIGDSIRARRIIEGVEEGRNIINTLTKHDYLDIYV